MKHKYIDKQKQAAYENAYECLYFGYGKTYWNNCGLTEDVSEDIWKQAYDDICSEE